MSTKTRLSNKPIKNKTMLKETLLEKAKKIQPYNSLLKEITDEHIELAIAWLKSEITNGQVASVLGINKSQGSTILYKLALMLRQAYKNGKLVIK